VVTGVRRVFVGLGLNLIHPSSAMGVVSRGHFIRLSSLLPCMHACMHGSSEFAKVLDSSIDVYIRWNESVSGHYHVAYLLIIENRGPKVSFVRHNVEAYIVFIILSSP
jgi:hypothetical protein